MLEVKGLERSVARSARAAARDLLAYRRAFEATLAGQATAYGIGIAWGRHVVPALGEIILCSPDTIGEALKLALSEAEGSDHVDLV
jgi:hypothetical protein